MNARIQVKDLLPAWETFRNATLSGPHVQYSFTPSLSCTAGLNRSGLALPQFFAGSLPGGA